MADITLQCKSTGRQPRRPKGPCPAHADYSCLQPIPTKAAPAKKAPAKKATPSDDQE